MGTSFNSSALEEMIARTIERQVEKSITKMLSSSKKVKEKVEVGKRGSKQVKPEGPKEAKSEVEVDDDPEREVPKKKAIAKRAYASVGQGTDGANT